MDYSFHIRLIRGTLKIKSEGCLRTRERNGDVPTLRIGSTYFVWQTRTSKPWTERTGKPWMEKMSAQAQKA